MSVSFTVWYTRRPITCAASARACEGESNCGKHRKERILKGVQTGWESIARLLMAPVAGSKPIVTVPLVVVIANGPATRVHKQYSKLGHFMYH